MTDRDRLDTHRVYNMLNSSGLRCVLKSFVNWYVVSLLYHQPQGMTSTMIYENYRKGPVEPNMARELRESRSCVIVHLNELEEEGVVQKGLFKQYMLTGKGRTIFENISKLTREVKPEVKEGLMPEVKIEGEKITAKPAEMPGHVSLLSKEKEPKRAKEKDTKPKIKEIEDIKKSRIGLKRT